MAKHKDNNGPKNPKSKSASWMDAAAVQKPPSGTCCNG